MQILYDNFIIEPEIYLMEFCSLIGIDYEKGMPNLEKVNHMVCGNSSRLNAKKIEKRKKSFDDLSHSDMKNFEKFAGNYNNKILSK